MDHIQAEQLVARYGQTIYRLAYARTGSREDAEDITQETFLRLVRANPQFQDEEHRKAWLLRVATNCAGDLFRAPWRRKNRPLEEAEHIAAEQPEPERAWRRYGLCRKTTGFRCTCFITRECLWRKLPKCWASGKGPSEPACSGHGLCCGIR